MAISLFSLKKTSSPKVTSFIDPTKFGGAASSGKKTLRSEIADKQTSVKEVKELNYIRRALEVLVSLEKKHFEFIGDSIKNFVLSEDKKQLKQEEALLEKKDDKNIPKKEDKKSKETKRGLGGIVEFFQGLIKTFITYKILEWAGNPENAKKIQDFVTLFTNIFKFLNAIVGFGIDKLLSGFSKLVGGEGVTRVFGFLEAVVGFFTLKWLLNPTKIISDIKMIGNLFTKVIPNAINGIIGFFSNMLPKAASDAADEALNQAGKQISGDAASVAKGATTATEATGVAAKGAATAAKGATTAAKGAGAAAKGAGTAAKGAAKGGAKVTGKSLLKALPVIGAVSSGVFALDRASKGDWLGAGGEVLSGIASLVPGWGTAASLGIDAALIGRDIAKEQGIPMLAKGGIVTKPTEAIVGEAGPEAILPLDKLGSFGADQFKGEVDKQIPKFIKLLSLPFKIVGAGIVALISSSVSSIPGLGPILMPLISNVASMFGIPPSMVKGMSNFATKAVKAVGQGMSGLKEVFGMEEPKITKSKPEEFKPTGDTSVRGLLGDILSALISKNSESSSTQQPSSGGSGSGSPADSGAPSAPTSGATGGGSTGAPTNTAQETMKKAGGLREDGSIQGVKGQTIVTGGGRSRQEKYAPGAGLKPVINGNRKYWYNDSGDVFMWQKPGDPLTDLTSADDKSMISRDVLKGILVRDLKDGTVKILQGMDQTPVGYYNYEMGSVLKKQGEAGQGRSKTGETKDKWEKPADGKYGPTITKKDKGGPIRGSGIGDKVSVLAEPGEYMLNRNAAKAMGGPKVLDKINHGLFPRFGSGGPIATRKFLRLGGGWAPVPEDAKGVYLGRGTEHGYAARDLPMPVGTPLLAPFDGKVQEINKNPGGWGNYIVMKSNNGIFSLFGHVSAYSKKQGDNIKTGEQVASSGHQHGGGRSTGPHLHWEIGNSWNGTIGSKVEPIAWTKGKATPSVSGQTSSSASTDVATKDENTTQAPATWESIAGELQNLAKLLIGSPAAPELPVASEKAKDKQTHDKLQPSAKAPPKMTGTPTAPAQNLQSAQKQNNRLQAQKRATPSGGPNIVTIPSAPNNITGAANVPVSQPLGGTTPPTPLTLFPIAP